MYSLDTVVYTKNVFVKKVVLDVKKLDFCQKLEFLGGRVTKCFTVIVF